MNFNNRKIKVLFLLFISCFCLSACKNNTKDVSVNFIDVDTSTLKEAYDIDEFDLSSINIRVSYTDNKFQIIPVSKSMLSDEDVLLLSNVGHHQINITYEGKTTTISLNLRYNTLKTQLMTIYSLATSSNSFIGTYEEWLETIKGPQGNSGKEVTFRTADGYIQWQYVGDLNWNNLVSLSTLTGASGIDGTDGKEVLFRVHENFIQWQYLGDQEWTNLINTSEFIGEKGDSGSQGKSAYEIYLEYFPGYDGSEFDWIKDLASNKFTITINFNTNCEFTLDSIEVMKGEIISIPNMSEFIFGYEFGGWYLDEALENPIMEEISFMANQTLYAKWSSLEIEVSYVIDGDIYHISNEYDYDKPNDPEKLGYVFKGWYLSLDNQEEFKFDYNLNQDTILYAKFDFLESEIPFVVINTNDGNEIVSKEVYSKSTVSILNTINEYIILEVSAGIRGRGNSTWNQPKKPYRIKFDKKTSVFGMPAAKDWVLLADYLDPSSMHNFSAFTFANSFEFAPYEHLIQHVRLYINGTYRGLYLMTQNPDEKENRVGINQDIYPEMTKYKYMIEFDLSIMSDPNPILGDDYFIQTINGIDYIISFDYPKKDDFDNSLQFYDFSVIVQFELNRLIETLELYDYEEIIKYLDEDSLIDYIFIDQLLGEKDHFHKSFKLHTFGDGKFYFGPIWDYDWALNTPWTGLPNTNPGVLDLSFNNVIKILYAATTEGIQKIKDKWEEYSNYSYNNALITIQNEINLIRDEAYLDSILWYNGSNKLIDDNITYLMDYLNGMKNLMDEYYSN